ncbi:hypothetical protein BJX66DRAFT_296755, partial [Aspergillus keveii]
MDRHQWKPLIPSISRKGAALRDVTGYRDVRFNPIGRKSGNHEPKKKQLEARSRERQEWSFMSRKAGGRSPLNSYLLEEVKHYAEHGDSPTRPESTKVLDEEQNPCL